MPGCRDAEILRYGYAVEYDMVRPHQIEATGMTRLVRGLFLAGQINGTSGYEEAAAQGLIAGINAARLALGLGEFTLARDEAYIGVLMDDLVTKTPVEPYRMFTSRAEHRLLLRADNAPDRLTPIADRLGLLGSTALGRARRQAFERRKEVIEALRSRIASGRSHGKPLSQALRLSQFEPGDLVAALRDGDMDFDATCVRREITTVYADHRYEPYVERERVEIRRRAELEHRRLPEAIDYHTLSHLRNEARHALSKHRPRTFGQAGRLEGITPADLTLLSVLVDKWSRARTTGEAPGA
jgi:tRNA uridine 5-carboxymethylaminomethyl modification enzyme